MNGETCHPEGICSQRAMPCLVLAPQTHSSPFPTLCSASPNPLRDAKTLVALGLCTASSPHLLLFQPLSTPPPLIPRCQSGNSKISFPSLDSTASRKSSFLTPSPHPSYKPLFCALSIRPFPIDAFVTQSLPASFLSLSLNCKLWPVGLFSFYCDKLHITFTTLTILRHALNWHLIPS